MFYAGRIAVPIEMAGTAIPDCRARNGSLRRCYCRVIYGIGLALKLAKPQAQPAIIEKTVYVQATAISL